jgi:hypothetical protein
MPTRNELFPSRFVKAADVSTPRTMTIASADLETFRNDGKEQIKLVLCFRERGSKQLVINATNFDAVAVITGSDESSDWVGHQIELFADRVLFQGRPFDCVRVRAPRQASMPLTNGAQRPPAASPQPVAKPQPPQPVAEPASDLNDEIPWK